MLELIVVLLLLRCTGNPQYKLRDFFQEKQSTSERNWLLASALGFVFLVVLVFITSIIADTLVGTKVSCFHFLFQLQYQFDCWKVYICSWNICFSLEACKTKAPDKLVDFECVCYWSSYLHFKLVQSRSIVGDKVNVHLQMHFLVYLHRSLAVWCEKVNIIHELCRKLTIQSWRKFFQVVQYRQHHAF